MRKKSEKPPVLARWMLKVLSHYEDEFSLSGDCGEEYREILSRRGKARAALWFWGQVLRAFPAALRRGFGLRLAMLGNYLKIAVRTIRKHKAFSLINISGLAIGMACCILLLLFVNSELSFDRYHEKRDRIFRVCHEYIFSNLRGRGGSSNAPSADVLRADYPEVIEATRFGWVPVGSVRYKDREFSDSFRYADETVFGIFTWPLIQGDPETALSAPYSIVITRESADKYFRGEDPLGKLLLINDDEAYRVTGVMEDIPRYSTLDFDGLCSFKTLYEKDPDSPLLSDWISFNFETYILLDEDVDARAFEGKIKNLLFDFAGERLKAKGGAQLLFLQPLRDVYLRSLNRETSPITYVTIFSAVALFILLIACANFMNLSTARAMSRSSEVGTRKVLGATRPKLIRQFLGESLLYSTLAMAAALALVFVALPAVNNLVRRDLYQDFLGIPWLLPGIAALTVFVGVAAGSYPAFVISRFSPLRMKRIGSDALLSSTRLRQGMVILQFAISITLIIGTGLVMQQLDYLKNRDPGFEKEHVVIVPIPDDQVRRSLRVIQEKFRNHPQVIQTGASSSLPGWGSAINDTLPEGFDEDEIQLMHEINVGEGYIPALGIELASGRNFSREYGSDPSEAVIINQAAVRRFGWADPLGKTIKLNNLKDRSIRWAEMTVIGVIKDYHIRGMQHAIEPAVLRNASDHPYPYGYLRALAVRVKPGSAAAVLEYMEEIWEEIFPQKPMEPYFLDASFNRQFAVMERSRNTFSSFTFMAILIACLGLFGMAAFTAERRTKEIGIRKTLGGSVSGIVMLLSRELLLLVLAANLLAYPLAYVLIRGWLRDFPYRIGINAQTFVLSTLLAIVISLAVIASQAFKAALADPIDALRYE